ncbi:MULTISPECIES: TetR/AcrR family transcriptional regulator [unclassified Pseudomonas]|uniref:TetR/AcrR family transcriptional regulator n=1 Tax=unclassified Pseudomonas TaxID=196821 RepID=UPI000C2FE026|nr:MULTISPECIES: TetR/AcrR family transcriptional regulator [unclassified Pseudomonas]MCU1737985.1 TetR/AcrR family transcriptional regulator [Pseudomonas sp. 20S_6.2_Bac1]
MAILGRPRAFDRDKAVEQAMYMFWQNGYESTSLSLLKAGIGKGISAPSFYAAFGSKEALFQECVQRYLATFAQVTASLWNEDLPPRKAIETTLRNSAKMQCDDGHPKGCMVGLGVIGVPADDRTETSSLARSRAQTRAGMIFCVERGVESGELRLETNIRALATVFDSFLLGLSTLARDGIPYSEMSTAITHIMSTWDAYSTNIAIEQRNASCGSNSGRA